MSDKHYPEEWTDRHGVRRLTCVCGEKLPCPHNTRYFHGIREVELLGGSRISAGGKHDEIEVKFKDNLIAWVREEDVYAR